MGKENMIEMVIDEMQDECELVEVHENIPQNTPVQMSVEKTMELSKMLSDSTIVPTQYQKRPENCFIAIDMANRLGVSPMVVMQNLYIIQGRPSFSGQAIASMIRANPQFKDVTLHFVGEEGKDSWGAYVTATRAHDGRELKGATVTIGTAKAEGWATKSGSKWKTLPELMLTYRAYTFFGRQHSPELMMGMQSSEEIGDVNNPNRKVENPYG